MAIQIEPLDRPPAAAGTFCVYWPDWQATSKLHNLPVQAGGRVGSRGDVLILLQQRCMMIGVQPFADWKGPWFTSVRECLGA